MPFSRSSRRAASTSPPVSSSARLQSIIPAPVWSRSSFTRLAEIATVIRTAPPLPAARGPAAVTSRWESFSYCGSSATCLARSARLAAGRLAPGSAPRPAARRSRPAGSRAARPSAGPRRCRRRSRGRSGEHERIASSLPGITYSDSSGSQFVSTSAITGTCSRCASRTASCSLRRSMMKIASGWRRMSATPPRLASSFSSSPSIEIRSLAGSSSSWPSSLSRRSSCRRSIRSEIVRQFVSRPPSQRWFT